MDAATAEALVVISEAAAARLRRQEPGATEALEERRAELGEALDWFLDAGAPETAYRLAAALVPFWLATSSVDEGDAWFERALGAESGADAVRAGALHEHGYLVFFAGRYDVAAARFAESLALAEELGDASIQALALAGLARLALVTDVAEAVDLTRRAVDATVGLADSDRGRSSALHVLGVALQMAGDLGAAREVMSARLSEGRSRGDLFVVWVESANLSMVERQLGNLDRAEELALEALGFDAARGAGRSTAWTLNSVAAVAAAKGELERAAVLVGLAASLLDRAGGEWPPDERAQHDETIMTITAGLSPDLVAEARSRGAAMSVDDGLALARRSSV